MKSEMITNRKRAAQLLAFDGIEYGKLRPTDIDFAIDFSKKMFIYGELKGSNKALTVGQRIHLEGLVKAIRAGDRVAYAFCANHDTPDTEHDVLVADALVASVYNGTEWYTPENFDGDLMTVKEWLDLTYACWKDGTITP